MATLNATQEAVDSAVNALAKAMKHPIATILPDNEGESRPTPEQSGSSGQPDSPEHESACFASVTPWAAVWLLPAAGLALVHRRKRT